MGDVPNTFFIPFTYEKKDRGGFVHIGDVETPTYSIASIAAKDGKSV